MGMKQERFSGSKIRALFFRLYVAVVTMLLHRCDPYIL